MSVCKIFMSHTTFCLVAIGVLGGCLLNQGKLDDAEKLLRESLDMQRSACPGDKATIAFSKLSSCL